MPTPAYAVDLLRTSVETAWLQLAGISTPKKLPPSVGTHPKLCVQVQPQRLSPPHLSQRKRSLRRSIRGNELRVWGFRWLARSGFVCRLPVEAHEVIVGRLWSSRESHHINRSACTHGRGDGFAECGAQCLGA